MENLLDESAKLTAQQQTAAFLAAEKQLKRDNDSIDDFEHLETSDAKQHTKLVVDDDIYVPPRGANVDDLVEHSTVDDAAAATTAINIGAATGTALDAGDHTHIQNAAAAAAATSTTSKQALSEPLLINDKSETMDINELANQTDLLSSQDDFLNNITTKKTEPDDVDQFLNGLKNTTTTNLLDFEHGNNDHNTTSLEPTKLIQPSFNDLADKFTDSDPDLDIDEDRYDDQRAKFSSADDLLRNDSPNVLVTDQFKDVIHEHEIPAPAPSAPPAEIPIKGFTIQPDEPVHEFIKDEQSPSISPINIQPSVSILDDIVPAPVQTVKKPIEVTSKPEVAIMQAEEMFLKMGLDTWFNPERLHPTVESLIYWRNPKKSGAVFGSVLVILLSLAYFSLISVTAYLSLLVLLGTISFRIYKTVMQAVQKTSDGHPFKEYLEFDLTLPQDKVKDITELVVTHINGGVNELRRLFLVEDLIDSIKFGILLWCLTYIGAWFNGMTLVIIGFIALFTLPKVYETNKTQIDANLDLVRTKIAEITSKVKAAVPIGKKSEDKKEQ